MAPNEHVNKSTPTATTVGRYRILEKLGEGGMANVYKAEMGGPEGFSKIVALKIVHAHLALQPEFTRSFISEARIGGYLSHPNIVETLDFGQIDERLFLVMEYVSGTTLERILEWHCRRAIPIPPDVALQLMIQVCQGLDLAHRAVDREGNPLRMVHRDIKPSNILISAHAQVKVADFGVARAESNLSRTAHTGMLKGTVRYMSPEQAWGERTIDARSDIFAVGLCLFELVTLTPMYQGRSQEAVLRLAQDADVAPRLNDIPPGLAREPLKAILNGLLARDPGDRCATAGAVSRQLEEVLTVLPRRVDLQTWLRDFLSSSGGASHDSGDLGTNSDPSSIPPPEASISLEQQAFPDIPTTEKQRWFLPGSQVMELAEGGGLKVAPRPGPPSVKVSSSISRGTAVGRTRIEHAAPPGGRRLPWLLAVSLIVLSILAGGILLPNSRGVRIPTPDTERAPAIAHEQPGGPADPSTSRTPSNFSTRAQVRTHGEERIPPQPLPGKPAVAQAVPRRAGVELSTQRIRVAEGNGVRGRTANGRTTNQGSSSTNSARDTPPQQVLRTSALPPGSTQAVRESMNEGDRIGDAPIPGGRLFLNSRPPSIMSVDGAPLAGFPIQNYALSQGTHIIGFEHEGRRLEQRIVVESSAIVRCAASFETGAVRCRQD